MLFCLDVWVATHAKTLQRNDFRQYRIKITVVFFDNIPNCNSQTVTVAFSWYAETGKILTLFNFSEIGSRRKLSGPMIEVEASSRNLRRFSMCNI